MSKVKRVYVEKKKPYAVKAKELTEDIKGYLGIDGLKEVRELVRYDVENLTEDTYKKAPVSYTHLVCQICYVRKVLA